MSIPNETETKRYQCPITRHLKSELLRARGQNRKLADDVELLPPDSQDRLYRILQDLAQERDSARRGARQGYMRGIGGR